MNKAELKELIKQVVAEETEYQKLFKTMLDRSGKDINSMSDEEKKKFFSAVDKAYKAKSEGKLVDSKKKINEDLGAIFGNSLTLFILGKILYYFIARVALSIRHSVYKKEDEWALKYVLDRLYTNPKFIKDLTNIVKDKKKLGATELEKIGDLPYVLDLVKKAADETNKKFSKDGGKILDWGVTMGHLKDAIYEAQNDIGIKNDVIEKVKNDIKK